VKDRRFVRVHRCACDWCVQPLPDARIKAIRQKVDEYVAAIEQEGLARFCASIDATISPSVTRIFNNLWIYSGYTTVWKPPGRIGIDAPIHVDMTRVDSRHVLRVIGNLALRKREQLAAVNAPERHLFIYLHPRNYPAWVSQLGSGIPSEPLTLPTEITDVWVAAPDRSEGLYVVRRFSAGQGWRDLGRIAV